MEHFLSIPRLKTINKLKQPGGLKPLNRILLLLTSLLLILSGCNFPQPAQSTGNNSSQYQTEVAGILNPAAITPQEILTSMPTLIPTESLPSTLNPLLPTLQPINGYILYTTRQGDTLPALANRFGVASEVILSQTDLPDQGFLPIGVSVQIPDVLDHTLPISTPILPDSEVIYGPTGGDFNASEYGFEAGGFLASYSEPVNDKVLMGPDIVQRVAIETSTNPRLLLAFLEYQSGWVSGFPLNAEADHYPIGYGATADPGLYKELMITARLLAQGFYEWRDGTRVQLTFYGGGEGRLDPRLNAGSAAIMRVFASLYRQNNWQEKMVGASSFPDFYQQMFGDYWERAAAVEPYLPDSLQQPDLVLPFSVGEKWSLTAGPHLAWQTGTPRGALDFAPVTGEPACAVSSRWVMAAAPGLVIRSDNSVVALDLDGDGDEGTGWVLIYQHIAESERVPAGTWLNRDDTIGHPSCEGGHSTGTHVHLARKYNGEWLGVGEPLPLVISGWTATAGIGRYEGILQKGYVVINAQPNGSAGSTIIRDE